MELVICNIENHAMSHIVIVKLLLNFEIKLIAIHMRLHVLKRGGTQLCDVSI